MKVFKLNFPKRGRFSFFDFIIEPKNENLYCGAEYMTVLAPVASAKDSFTFHIKCSVYTNTRDVNFRSELFTKSDCSFSRISHLLGIPSHLCETRALLRHHRCRSSNLIETYKELLLVSRFLFTDKLLLPMKFDINGFH